MSHFGLKTAAAWCTSSYLPISDFTAGVFHHLLKVEHLLGHQGFFPKLLSAESSNWLVFGYAPSGLVLYFDGRQTCHFQAPLFQSLYFDQPRPPYYSFLSITTRLAYTQGLGLISILGAGTEAPVLQHGHRGPWWRAGYCLTPVAASV